MYLLGNATLLYRKIPYSPGAQGMQKFMYCSLNPPQQVFQVSEFYFIWSFSRSLWLASFQHRKDKRTWKSKCGRFRVRHGNCICQVHSDCTGRKKIVTKLFTTGRRQDGKGTYVAGQPYASMEEEEDEFSWAVSLLRKIEFFGRLAERTWVLRKLPTLEIISQPV